MKHTEWKNVAHLYKNIKMTPVLKHSKSTVYWNMPTLRRLSSMTNEEAKEMILSHKFWSIYNIFNVHIDRGYINFKVIYKKGRGWDKKVPVIGESPEQFVYLLSKGFDLFGLIESGQAIEK